MMNQNELEIRLKELRAAKARKLNRRKIPQREVAAHLNISTGAYASWESGRTKPDVTLLPEIADYFGVSIDSLLGHTAGVPVSQGPVTDQAVLAWSLRRPAQTENERQAIEVWRQLADGKSSESIAAALKVHSLLKIERCVKDLVYTDLISIDHLPQDTDLARQLQQTFKLREVIVIPVMAGAPFILRNILLGEAARAYFKSHVYEGMNVGLAGGYSVSRLVYSLRRGECPPIEVYPLAISPVIEAVSLDANSLVGALAYRQDGYGVKGFALQYASPSEWKRAKDPQQFAATLRILARAKRVEVAFMGIGVVGRRRASIDLLGDLLSTRGLDFGMMRRERGAVGDILYHLVDQNGNQVASEISELICSIDLQDLREMVQWGAQVVVIASRREKLEIAQAAIKARYANVFIIDDELARAMLLDK